MAEAKVDVDADMAAVLYMWTVQQCAEAASCRELELVSLALAFRRDTQVVCMVHLTGAMTMHIAQADQSGLPPINTSHQPSSCKHLAMASTRMCWSRVHSTGVAAQRLITCRTHLITCNHTCAAGTCPAMSTP